MLKKLWKDEAGVIISAELVLVLTIAVLAMIVGLSEVAVAVNTELNDISNAFGRMDQSYGYTGFKAAGGVLKSTSAVNGAVFADKPDDGDVNTSCDLVCGIASVPAAEGGP